MCWLHLKDQLTTILNVLGTPANDDIEEITDPQVRSFLRDPRNRMVKVDLQNRYPVS